jgi:signal transduction histidine kinase
VSRLSSLRARIFLGAVLWTIGLFIAGVIFTTLLMMRHRGLPAALHGTTYRHAPIFLTIAGVCVVIGLLQVRSGLSAVNQLRAKLADVREGRSPRIDGSYPSEVQPLVDDLNGLLDHRERAVARAIARAGDLAHGLKTPLAILAQEADRSRLAGHHEVAVAIAQQVERMRRQTDYHLAQARAAASGAVASGARCQVLESAEALIRTMARLHADRGLTFEARVAADLVVRCQREDLDEMLGNLVDNASKWARARVDVSAGRAGGDVSILVEDDGPGIPASMREAVLQRGVRADQAAPGSGLGLAIVRDLAEVYGGSIALAGSAAGGLRARLTLPSA